MKRELKFRYWDGSNMYYHTTLWDGKLWDTMQDIEIDGYELMQSTGLKDKNDKEIWESDILKCHSKKVIHKESGPEPYFEIPEFKDIVFNNVIYWLDSNKPNGFRIKGGKFSKQLTFSTIYNMEAEVIGNIYENPELIK